jgi:hypothetical protein
MRGALPASMFPDSRMFIALTLDWMPSQLALSQASCLG